MLLKPGEWKECPGDCVKREEQLVPGLEQNSRECVFAVKAQGGNKMLLKYMGV